MKSMYAVSVVLCLTVAVACKPRPTTSLQKTDDVAGVAKNLHWNTPRQQEAVKIWRQHPGYLTAMAIQIPDEFNCGNDDALSKEMLKLEITRKAYEAAVGGGIMQTSPDVSYRFMDLMKAYSDRGLLDKRDYDAVFKAFATHFAQQEFFDFEPRVVKYSVKAYTPKRSDAENAADLKARANDLNYEASGSGREMGVRCFKVKTGKNVPSLEEIKALKDSFDRLDQRTNQVNKNATIENTPNLQKSNVSYQEAVRLADEFKLFMYRRNLALVDAMVALGSPYLDQGVKCANGSGSLLQNFGTQRCEDTPANRQAYLDFINKAFKAANFDDAQAAGGYQTTSQSI